MTGLEGRMCVVTGATSGIGHRLTLALAREGAVVWAIGRTAERLETLAADVQGLRGEVAPVLADLENDEDLKKASEHILSRTETVDILVHSAGAIVLGSFESISGAAFDRLYRVNLRAPFVLTQGLLAALRRARGQVVFINSSAGLRASADNVLYAATKHGLKAIADGLRDEVNPDRIRVISVYLGRTATPMQRSVHEYEGREYRSELLLGADDVVDVVLAALSLPATGEVTDVSVRPIAKLDPR
jgi:NADP-dependent 3-hydroxy acid dehydrogenase YdfG